MANKRSVKSSASAIKPKLTGREIQRRIMQIELATMSSLRALQMDIADDKGVPSASVLKRARAVLTKVPATKPEPDDEPQ